MEVLIINAFALLGLSHAFVFPGAQESNACISDNDALNCLCKHRDHIAMSASMNFNINKIQVSGCGDVNVPFGAVPHLELEKIIFSDIYKLTVQPFAFVGAQTLHTLLIEDIGYFIVGTHGFVGLLNVTNIIIRNITSMSLQEGAFGGISEIKNFHIEDSNLNDVKNGAFILTNITYFKIMNSEMEIIDSNSFLIHNNKHVSFENCSIQEARNNSFSFAYLTSLEFYNCSFGVLNTNSINLRVSGSFTFESCSVSELYTYAFTLTNVMKTIKFSHNIIEFGYDEPMLIITEIPNIGDPRNGNFTLNTCCNSFLCNCDIYWMWNAALEMFYDFHSSSCIGTETSLANMEPILDSHGNCMTLESKENLVDKSSAYLIHAGYIFKIMLVYLLIFFGIIV